MDEDTQNIQCKKKVYLALAGGGAKGIVHAGAYAHVSRNYEIVGVSGTSAGAIVAALIAAGFTADEIFYENSDGSGISPLFDKIKSENCDVKLLSDLLGPDNFKSLRRMRSYATTTFEIIFLRRKLSIFIVSILMALIWSVKIEPADTAFDNCWKYIISCVLDALLVLMVPLLKVLLTFILAMSHIFLSITSVTKNGIASTSRAIDAVCDAIAEKIGLGSGKDVYLDSLRMPIMIVATDIKGKKAKVFRSYGDRIKLRDALSASICIPVIFPPHAIDGAEYFDGGIVSNLPLYVFAEFGYLFPNRKIIGFGIVEDNEPDPAPSRFKFVERFRSVVGRARKKFENTFFPVDEVKFYMGSVFGTFFTGTQELAHIVTNAVPINIKTKLRTTEFDVSPAGALLAYKQGVTHAALVDNEFKVDMFSEGLCSDLHRFVCKNMKSAEQSHLEGDRRVRVALAFRKPHNFASLSLKYSYGFSGSPDMHLDIPIDSTSCGEAWKSLEPVFEQDPANIFRRLNDYEHIVGRVSPDMKWVICVPIVLAGMNEPEFVVNIDGNWTLGARLVDETGVEIDLDVAIFNITREILDSGRALATAVKDQRESAQI